MPNLATLIKQARKNPSVLKSNEFIHARIFSPDSYIMLLEMGPNCNLRCSACCDDCGPDKIGLPSQKIVDRAFADAYRCGIFRVSLTDGEPLREENKGVVKVAAKASSYFEVALVTNGTFANTPEKTLEWFDFLKQNEYNFRISKMRVSAGAMYPTTKHHFENINQAAGQVTEKDAGNFLSYLFLLGQDTKDNQRRLMDLVQSIQKSLGKKRVYTYSEKPEDRWIKVHVSKGKPVNICIGEVEPFGRAANLAHFNKNWPVKKLELEELFFEEYPVTDFSVMFDGGVHFNDNGGIFGRNNVYGNIKEEHLGVILRRMRADTLFQGFKLGCTPLLYYATKQINPNYSVTGRTGWDVLRYILRDKDLLVEVRKYLSHNGVVDTYKKFVASVDLSIGPKI